VVVYLERGEGLHMAQLMPLPLTVSCFSKIQIGSTFLVPAHPGSPGKRAVKRVCVCVSVCLLVLCTLVMVVCPAKTDEQIEIPFKGHTHKEPCVKMVVYAGIIWQI